MFLLSLFRTEDNIENTVSLFVATCCYVRLTSLYTTLALLTWSGIVAHSYFPEAGNNFTSSQVYFINQENTRSQKKLSIAFNQAAYTTIVNLLTQSVFQTRNLGTKGNYFSLCLFCRYLMNRPDSLLLFDTIYSISTGHSSTAFYLAFSFDIVYWNSMWVLKN